jgi:hypothetical protein
MQIFIIILKANPIFLPKKIRWTQIKNEKSFKLVIGFWFLLDDLLEIIFLHSEIFEFSYFFFCLKILFNVNGKATMLPTPLVNHYIMETLKMKKHLEMGEIELCGLSVLSSWYYEFLKKIVFDTKVNQICQINLWNYLLNSWIQDQSHHGFNSFAYPKFESWWV